MKCILIETKLVKCTARRRPGLHDDSAFSCSMTATGGRRLGSQSYSIADTCPGLKSDGVVPTFFGWQWVFLLSLGLLQLGLVKGCNLSDVRLVRHVCRKF